jgi:tripartite-type tricarboxylate transporter receptor subunit TctC
MLTKLLSTVGCLAVILSADPAASLESNDRVTVVVPYSPGGGFDTQARLIAPHLESELRSRGFSEVNVVVNNVRGGGGAIATSAVYGARPDGTTLLLLDPESTLWQQTLSETVFDMGEFTYLAQLSSDPFTLSVREDMDIKDFGDAIERSQTTPLLVATSGHGSVDHILPLIIQKALAENGVELNLDFLFFAGTSDKIASIRRGESELTAASTTAIQGFVNDGVVKIILTFAEDGDAMQAKDLLGLPEEEYALLSAGANQRRVIVAPPGMDESTRDTLREALDAVLNDPELIAEAEKAQQVINYMSGADVQLAIEMELELAERYSEYVRQNVEN